MANRRPNKKEPIFPVERSARDKLVPGAGIEPARHIVPRDFKSLASTISATRAGPGVC